MKKRKKILEGEVVSTKMQKTVVVKVVSISRHPLYGKNIKKAKKYKAHYEGENIQVGDRVKIIENRPYSKEKHFRVLEILNKQ